MTILISRPLPMVDRLQTAKDLEAAADVLQDVGLHKRGLYDTAQYDNHTITRFRCRQDVRGAIRTAVVGTPGWTDHPGQIARIDRAEAALLTHLGIRWQNAGLDAYNDLPQRQLKQVVKALRDTADGLRGEQP